MFISKLKKIREEIEDELGYEVDFNIYPALDFLRLHFKIDPYKLVHLGDGCNGFAYCETVSSEPKVVKITNDEFEIKIAKELQGKNNKYLADIYGVYKLYDDYYLIVQEKLEIKFSKEMEDARTLMEEIISDNRKSMEDMIRYEDISDIISEKEDEDENIQILFLDEECDPHCIEILRSAYNAFDECKEKTGYSSNDFHLYNMGIKSNGNIGFFDQTIY